MAKNTFSAGAGFYEFGGHAGVKYKYSIDDLHALSAAVGVVGMIGTVLRRSFDYSIDYYVKAKEVKEVESKYTKEGELR